MTISFFFLSEHGSLAPRMLDTPLFGGGRGDRRRDERHEVSTREFTQVRATWRCNTLRPAW